MKKPNITQGEWSISDFRPRVGVLKYDRLAITPVCDFDRELDWMDDPDMKAISAVPEMIDALISIMEDVKLTKYMGSVRRVKAINALKKAGVEL